MYVYVQAYVVWCKREIEATRNAHVSQALWWNTFNREQLKPADLLLNDCGAIIYMVYIAQLLNYFLKSFFALFCVCTVSYITGD